MSKNNINTHDSAGLTQLIRSVLSNDLDSLNNLLKENANPDLCDKNGNSPLIFAALNDRWEAASLLLDAGANPNLRDSHGNTPLIWAVRRNKFAVTQTLLERGSKVNSSNHELKTALFFATENGCEEMVDFLIEKGAKVRVKTINQEHKIVYTLSPKICAADHSINMEETPKITEPKYWRIFSSLCSQERMENEENRIAQAKRPATAIAKYSTTKIDNLTKVQSAQK